MIAGIKIEPSRVNQHRLSYLELMTPGVNRKLNSEARSQEKNWWKHGPKRDEKNNRKQKRIPWSSLITETASLSPLPYKLIQNEHFWFIYRNEKYKNKTVINMSLIPNTTHSSCVCLHKYVIKRSLAFLSLLYLFFLNIFWVPFSTKFGCWLLAHLSHVSR